MSALPPQPAKRLAVVTCMDVRIEPLSLLGLALGDAHVIRNAGALVTDDVLRSLAVSAWLLGTREAMVIGHTECGMATFANEDLRALIGPGADGVDFLPFADVEDAVREGVRRIAESPLLPDAFSVSGRLYDVRTGHLGDVSSSGDSAL